MPIVQLSTYHTTQSACQPDQLGFTVLELTYSPQQKQASAAFKRMTKKSGGRAESRTRVTRFRVWCDNHYTTQPSHVFHHFFLGYMMYLAASPLHSTIC